MVDRPLGVEFELNGCMYVVVADRSSNYDDSCGSCAFQGTSCMDYADFLGVCVEYERKDNIAVHFELVDDDKRAQSKKGGE